MGAKWLRTLAAGLLAAALLLGCSGCIFRPVDELYYLPALPAEYSDLQSNINNTMVELGAEYATIYYGQNTSPGSMMSKRATLMSGFFWIWARASSPLPASMVS